MPTNPTTVSTPQEFAGALRELQREAGVSVRQVAARLGEPHSTIGGYLSGQHLPPSTRSGLLVRILVALDVGGDDIQGWLEAHQRALRARSRT